MTSVTSRLLALLLLLLGAGLLATGIVLDRDSRAIATRILHQEARRQLEVIALDAPAGPIARGDRAAVDAWCDRVGAALDHRVTVIDPGGRVLGDSHVSLDSIPLLDNHADRPEVRAALESGHGEASRRSWSVRRRLFYMAKPLAPAQGAAGPAVLRLAIPVTGEYEFGRRWQTHLWIGIGGVLLLFAAGASLVGRRIDRRLVALRASAEALGRGDLRARAPVDAHDELAGLARVLNGMASRLEAQLTEARAERDVSESVLGSLSQGLALLGHDLTIRHANRRFWDLVGIEPPAGEPSRLSAARQPALEVIAEEAIREGRGIATEVALYVGDRHEYEVSIRPVGERGGREAWLLSIESLSPEREMAQLRREFVANASHELKTPLTSIRGYAETLLHGGLEDEANRSRFVETIRDQAARLEALVEDLLELADLERPDAALDLKHWDLAQVVRELSARFEDLARRRGLELDLDLRSGGRALVDRKRLELALANLIDNAIKYTERGSISVRVEPVAGAIRVSVADTGRGIGSEHLPRLFERFYRVDRGRSRALGGTGLGLSIVKHVVQLHGGSVGVESAPGKGSVFWFEVPREGPSDRGGPGTPA